MASASDPNGSPVITQSHESKHQLLPSGTARLTGGRIWDAFDEEWAVAKMHWLVAKVGLDAFDRWYLFALTTNVNQGTTLQETRPVVIEVARRSLVENGPVHSECITIQVYNGDRDTTPVCPEQGI